MLQGIKLSTINPSFYNSYLISHHLSTSPKSDFAAILYPKVSNICRCYYLGLRGSNLPYLQVNSDFSFKVQPPNLFPLWSSRRTAPDNKQGASFLPHDTEWESYPILKSLSVFLFTSCRKSKQGANLSSTLP